MFDLNAIYNVIKTGGPPVVFVLLVMVGLFMSGQLKTKVAADAEAAAIERAHAAELAVRDRQIADLSRGQERIQEKMDREHELFQQALTLIRSDLIPLLRTSFPERRR